MATTTVTSAGRTGTKLSFGSVGSQSGSVSNQPSVVSPGVQGSSSDIFSSEIKLPSRVFAPSPQTSLTQSSSTIVLSPGSPSTQPIFSGSPRSTTSVRKPSIKKSPKKSKKSKKSDVRSTIRYDITERNKHATPVDVESSSSESDDDKDTTYEISSVGKDKLRIVQRTPKKKGLVTFDKGHLNFEVIEDEEDDYQEVQEVTTTIYADGSIGKDTQITPIKHQQNRVYMHDRNTGDTTEVQGNETLHFESETHDENLSVDDDGNLVDRHVKVRKFSPVKPTPVTESVVYDQDIFDPVSETSVISTLSPSRRFSSSSRSRVRVDPFTDEDIFTPRSPVKLGSGMNVRSSETKSSKIRYDVSPKSKIRVSRLSPRSTKSNVVLSPRSNVRLSPRSSPRAVSRISSSVFSPVRTYDVSPRTDVGSGDLQSQIDRISRQFNDYAKNVRNVMINLEERLMELERRM